MSRQKAARHGSDALITRMWTRQRHAVRSLGCHTGTHWQRCQPAMPHTHSAAMGSMPVVGLIHELQQSSHVMCILISSDPAAYSPG